MFRLTLGSVRVRRLSFAFLMVVLTFSFLPVKSPIANSAVNAPAPTAGAPDGIVAFEWTARAALPRPQAIFGTAAANGKLYVIGGQYDSGISFADTNYEYNPTVDSWVSKAIMPTKRTGLAAVAVDNKIYAIGGAASTSGGAMSTNEQYDPLADSWTTKAPMPTPRNWISAAAVNGKIFVLGGSNNAGSIYSTNEMYDPSTNTWTTKTALPTARLACGVGVVNGKIYLIGGWIRPGSPPGQPTALNEEYDPQTNTWSTKAPMPTARNGLAVVAVNGRIFAIGGATNFNPWTNNLNVVEEYDPSTDTWTSLEPMPTSRSLLGASIVDYKIYAIGGWNNNYLDQNEQLDLTGHLPWGITETSAIWDGRNAYIFGGGTKDGPKKTILKYDPLSDQITVMPSSLPDPITDMCAVYDGTYAYVFSGWDWGNSGKIVRYDPASDSVTTMKATLPTWSMSGVWNGQYAFLFGGWDGYSYYNQILRYNPVADQVTMMSATFPKGIKWNSAVWTGTYAYIFGGSENYNSPTNQIFRYDPATDSLTVDPATLPANLVFTSAVWTGTSALIFGGGQYAASSDKIISFDPTTDSVSVLDDMLPSSRWGTSAIWSGTAAYIFGGDNSETYFNDIFKYSPAGANFEVSVSPEQEVADPRSPTAFAVSVTSLNGFNQPVALNAVFSSHELSGTFEDPVVTPPANGIITTTLKVAVLSEEIITHQISITGTCGILSHTKSISLKVPYLSVPYFSQGDLRWCYPVSMAMIMGYFGVAVHPWDVAVALYLDHSASGVGLTQSLVFQYLLQNGLNYDLTGLVVSKQNLISMLAKNEPILLDLIGIQHAVVITGYREDTDSFFINDPSGYLVKDRIFPELTAPFINVEVPWDSLEPFAVSLFNYAIGVNQGLTGKVSPSIGTLDIIGGDISRTVSFRHGSQFGLPGIYIWSSGYVLPFSPQTAGLTWLSSDHSSIVDPNDFFVLGTPIVINPTDEVRSYEVEIKFKSTSYETSTQISVNDLNPCSNGFALVQQTSMGDFLGYHSGIYTITLVLRCGGQLIDKVDLPTIEYASHMMGISVVRGSNDIIYYRTYDSAPSGSSSTWNALPSGSTCDSPAAAVCGNELHFVVRGIDGNALWHGYVNLIGGGFSGWTLLSGSTPSSPTLTANSTHLCLVVRGQNNLIYYRFYDCTSQTWTDWAPLPSGSTCDSPAATMLANNLHIVVRGMDGYTFWHSSVDLSTGAFSGWDLVGGATESKPTFAACESRNEVILVVRGLNNVIYRNAWNGSGWYGWVGLPTGATCDGIGTTVIGETLDVVVRGMDGYTLWYGNVDLSTSAFSGWTLLDGSTPSTPTLTS